MNINELIGRTCRKTSKTSSMSTKQQNPQHDELAKVRTKPRRLDMVMMALQVSRWAVVLRRRLLRRRPPPEVAAYLAARPLITGWFTQIVQIIVVPKDQLYEASNKKNIHNHP